jgi:uncharacterized membrane protein
MKNTGGLFWDILLITEYNEDWENFYFSLIKVLPCKLCIEKSLEYHEVCEKVPKMKSTKEKNEYLWELRLKRGGQPWRDDVEKYGYTLDSWLAQYKGKPFSRINKLYESQ